MAGADGLMVMLVTSRGTGRWVLPKGWLKKNLSAPETAALEAFEEAGLVGTIDPEPIGQYSYAKQLPAGGTVACAVDIFPLHVTELLDDWPERAQRQRGWFTLIDAAAAVIEDDLTAILLTLSTAEPFIPH